MTNCSLAMFSIALFIFGTDVVWGQDYPTKPLRMVTASPGSGTDFTARLIAQGMAGPLGQPVIVENRPSGVIPGDIVAKATADGYTLLAAGGILWTGPLVQQTPYDPVKDFAPISLTVMSPNILVVNPSLPVKSVKELIAFAKANPRGLNYATGGTGASNHLAAELFKSMAGVNMSHIPYKGGAATISALIAGEAQVSFSGPVSVIPHIKSGKLRGLAVTSLQPSRLAPDLPTVAASGLPGFEFTSVDAILAPAKTPMPRINRLSQEIVRVLNVPDVQKKFFDSGLETVGSSPGEAAATIKSEIAKWGKVVKDAGIKAD